MEWLETNDFVLNSFISIPINDAINTFMLRLFSLKCFVLVYDLRNKSRMAGKNPHKCFVNEELLNGIFFVENIYFLVLVTELGATNTIFMYFKQPLICFQFFD